MQRAQSYTETDIINQIDNGVAVKVSNASFNDFSDTFDVRVNFYRLWGSVIKEHYNFATTTSKYYFLDESEVDLFNAHYSQ